MTEKPFDDYYEFLQISPNADLETIERIYRFLAKKCHPDNKGTGNSEKFNLITSAYKILSDPEKRAAYDANYEEAKTHQWKAFSEAPSSEGYETDNQIRRTILSILYISRRQNPSNSGVGNWQLEKMMGWPEKTMEFHIWYLREKNWIERTDTGGFAITAAGVDEIEKEGLILRKDRLIPQSTKSSEESEIIKLIAEESLETDDKYESAIVYLKSKVATNSDTLIVWLGLAYFYIKSGRDDEGAEALKKIYKIDSNFSIDNFLSTREFIHPGIADKISTHIKDAGIA